MRIRKIFAAILAVVLLVACFPFIPVHAEPEVITSGEVISRMGTMQWSFQDGVLTITGDDYCVDEKPVPWEHLNNKVRHLVFDGSLTMLTSQFSRFPLLESVTWPESITHLNGAFNNCYNLRQVTIPNSVKEIENSFNNCINLSSITLPNKLQRIADSFIRNTSLAQISFPGTLKEIFRSFQESGLVNVVIPASVTLIGDKAFGDSQCLKDIVFLGGPTITYYNPSFTNVTANVYYRKGSSKWTDEAKLSYGGNLTWVGVSNPAKVELQSHIYEKYWSISGNVLSIWGWDQPKETWFLVKDAVNEIAVLEGITSIPDFKFYAQGDLVGVTLPEGLTEIGNSAFHGCDYLENVHLPSTLTTIGNGAFGSCGHLETITIPASVKYLMPYAFNNSYSLKEIYFKGDAPYFGQGIFGNVKAFVYYPMDNETWTDGLMLDYGGDIEWIPYCSDHDFTTVTVEPDCLNPGAFIHTCKICDEVVTEPSGEPPQGHNYGVDDNGNPDFWDTTCDVCGAERKVDKHRPTHSMYRMYNPNSGEHFYTGSMEERKNLEAAGWKYEGVGFTFPATTGKPVYRLYDKDDTMEHLYTMDEEEKDKLLAEGWVLEGVAFNSGREDEVPQYRLHNPNATIGAYHFTASVEEKDMLIAAGWEYQGIGFYTCLQ